ncbi:MAG: CcmD family protein [Myxococcota bacterium]|jgi:CcmD family protein
MIVFATSGAGVVQGGWEYVYAAYGVTWLFFAGYTLSLVVRQRAADAASEDP